MFAVFDKSISTLIFTFNHLNPPCLGEQKSNNWAILSSLRDTFQQQDMEGDMEEVNLEEKNLKDNKKTLKMMR